MAPDVVVLVTGDADFAPLALQLRRRGIRVEAAAIAQTFGAGLKTAVNEAIDLAPLRLSSCSLERKSARAIRRLRHRRSLRDAFLQL